MAMSSVAELVGIAESPEAPGSPEPPAPELPAESPRQAAVRVAATSAAPAAPAVDHEARFPQEALIGLRESRLLAALVPTSLGGLGASLTDVAFMTETLAGACAATGMVFAMHQIQVACLVRHAAREPWFGEYLRELATEQPLIASATSEVGVGGDLRSSIAAVTPKEDKRELEKQAPTVSYGKHADAILATARRGPDSARSDQALVLLRKTDYTLEPAGVWNTLGMRGTCSPGFKLRASFAPEQVLATPFADIAGQTMVPVSHLLWSSVWLGIAADALARAHRFVRAEARQKPGTTPPSALRLAEAGARLDTLRARIAAVLNEYEATCASPDAAEQLGRVAWATKINGLKLSASELSLDIVTRALTIVGIAGYREEGELSVARHLRDIHSAPLMINNDRINAMNASLLLVQKDLI
jgi:acyl-CoA dehydrogenase